MKQIWLSCLLLFCPISTALALGPDTDVARASQTPFARNPDTKYYAFPFVNDLNYGYGAYGHTQDILDFKPIVSFQLTSNYDLIVRTIAPLLEHQPHNTEPQHNITGWGDLNPTTFISPMRYRTTIWGAGPTFFIPTATNQALGTGKWSIGPEFAAFTMPQQWVLGILTSNVWSIVGDSSRQAVNQFSLQYFISYNFPKGWYLTSQPTISANWKANRNQTWTIPFGIGIGKAFHFPNGGVVLSLQSYYNVIRPAKLGPNWTLQAKIEFDLLDRKVIPL
jgi:hypothetical protein